MWTKEYLLFVCGAPSTSRCQWRIREEAQKKILSRNKLQISQTSSPWRNLLLNTKISFKKVKNLTQLCRERHKLFTGRSSNQNLPKINPPCQPTHTSRVRKQNSAKNTFIDKKSAKMPDPHLKSWLENFSNPQNFYFSHAKIAKFHKKTIISRLKKSPL